MRYTTIIDISEYPALYKNSHVRLLYLHLCLRSGYHDDDRDICDISIRRLADEVGLTLSATRHALKVLSNASLISNEGGLIRVSKFVVERSISKRPRTNKEANQAKIVDEMRRRESRLQKEHDERTAHRQHLAAIGKTDFMIYYESLQTKAAQGDVEAMALVKRHKSTYESHCESMKAIK